MKICDYLQWRLSLVSIIFYTLLVVTVNYVERKRRQQFDKDDFDDLHPFEDPDELECDEVAQPLEKRNC